MFQFFKEVFPNEKAWIQIEISGLKFAIKALEKVANYANKLLPVSAVRGIIFWFQRIILCFRVSWPLCGHVNYDNSNCQKSASEVLLILKQYFESVSDSFYDPIDTSFFV